MELEKETTKVFISYSRKDLGFVMELKTALEMRGINALIDREDIAKSEDWWNRIQQLIMEADTVVFALSPDSALSNICQQEVDYAEGLNKRLIPIVIRDLATHPIPKALASLNYIFFTPNAAVGTKGDFNAALNELVDAIETDISWIREHTRLGSIATRWQTLARPHALELRGEELARAESWLNSRPRHAPEATEVQRAFLQASRQLASRQHRNLVGGLSGGLAVLSALTLYAFIRQQEAERQAAIALTSSAESNFRAKQQLPALLDSIKAVTLLNKRLLPTPKDTEFRAALMLRQAIYESREINRIEGEQAQSSNILSILYSPNGRMVASGDSGDSVVLWSPQGRAQHRLNFATQLILGLSFRPDGKKIAAIDRGNNVAIWSTIDGQASRDILSSLTYSGPQMDLKPTLRNQQRNNKAWENLWGKPGEPINRSESTVNRILAKRQIVTDFYPLESSPDASFFAVGVGKVLEKWSLDGALLSKLGAHNSEITDLAFSPNGTLLASASKDGSIKIWKPEGGFLLDINDPRGGHKAAIAAIGFSADGQRLLSLDQAGVGKIWDASGFKTGEPSRLETTFDWDSPTTEHPAVSISPDGNFFVAGYASGQIKFWAVDNLQPQTFTEDNSCSPDDDSMLRFSPDGTFLISSGCEDLRLWDANGKRKKKITYDAELRGSQLSVSRDSKRVFVSIEATGKSQLYNSEGTRLGKELPVPGLATLSPDGSQIAFFADQKLVWQSLEGSITRTLPLTTRQFSDCRGRIEFSDDGSKLISQGTMVICLIEARSGSIRTIKPPGRVYLKDFILSHDGKTLAIANFSHVVYVYDLSRREQMPNRLLVGHTGPVDHVRISSDDSTLITASSRDGTIRFWDRNKGLIHVLHTGTAISAIALSPDDGRLLSASDNTLTVWDLDLDRLLQLGCERLRTYLNSPSTNLSQEERRLCPK